MRENSTFEPIFIFFFSITLKINFNDNGPFIKYKKKIDKS